MIKYVARQNGQAASGGLNDSARLRSRQNTGCSDYAAPIHSSLEPPLALNVGANPLPFSACRRFPFPFFEIPKPMEMGPQLIAYQRFAAIPLGFPKGNLGNETD